MESGFNFELYETIFTNCFIECSRYKNGNLQLSLFGTEPSTNETTHFADITLFTKKILSDSEIVVDCKYKPDFIPQLLDLGILKRQVGILTENSTIYPIYQIDLTKITEKQYYYMQELMIA